MPEWYLRHNREARMIREINRKTWSNFCRKFNTTNRYRAAQLAFRSPRSSRSTTWETDLLGINLSKKGRRIDGIDVFAIQQKPEGLKQPRLEITRLEKLVLKQDEQGNDQSLTLISANGAKAEISFIGDSDPEGHDHLVEKIAYAISEQRGFSPGNDMDDWLEAEKVIDRICSELPG